MSPTQSRVQLYLQARRRTAELLLKACKQQVAILSQTPQFNPYEPLEKCLDRAPHLQALRLAIHSARIHYLEKEIEVINSHINMVGGHWDLWLEAHEKWADVMKKEFEDGNK